MYNKIAFCTCVNKLRHFNRGTTPTHNLISSSTENVETRRCRHCRKHSVSMILEIIMWMAYSQSLCCCPLLVNDRPIEGVHAMNCVCYVCTRTYMSIMCAQRFGRWAPKEKRIGRSFVSFIYNAFTLDALLCNDECLLCAERLTLRYAV